MAVVVDIEGMRKGMKGEQDKSYGEMTSQTIIAYTHLGIGITELDSNVSHQLVLKPDSHDPRYRLYHRRFTVSDMSDRSYIPNPNKVSFGPSSQTVLSSSKITNQIILT